MKILPVLLICSCAVLLTSCKSEFWLTDTYVRFSPPIKQTFNLNTNNAVVYGRFATRPQFGFSDGPALRLHEENARPVYLIECRTREPVYAIAVRPGRYKLTGYLATSGNQVSGQIDFRNSRVFEVRSNSLTYLGDFFAYAEIRPFGREWPNSEVTNNFAATTEEVRQKYPNLASSPTFSIYNEKLTAFGARSTSGLPAGDYRFVNSQGSAEAQGHFIDGKMDGLWLFWTSDGTKVAEISYDRGVRSGPFRLYWSNFLNPDFAGKLKAEGKAQNGKQVSEHISYLPDGQIDSRAKILEDGQIQPSIGSSEIARKKLEADDRYFAGLEAGVLGALEEK